MEIIRETVGGLLAGVSHAQPSHEALVHTEAGVRFTYDLLMWEAGRTARGLIRLGIEPGDCVALWASNTPEWITSQVAVARTGAVLVPLDPGIEAEDLHYVLSQCEARAVIMARGMEGDEYLPMIQSVRDKIPCLENIVLFGDTEIPETILWSELGAMGEDLGEEALQEREKAISPEDPLALMYTSGTTGKPKGVVLDHLGLVNKSMASTKRQGVDNTDRLCLFFPLFHMMGNTCIALAGLLRGATLVMPCRSFEPEAVLRAIRKESCTEI
ncbi:MAG: AMP-binding protein, partial [Desulfobacteraceae bacterium]